ncbi:hypothetical protein OAU53_01015 [Candidatus Pelagibacter sp.]|nr:hypothetical protein [Candidatus Pelagibacter sp.]
MFTAGINFINFRKKIKTSLVKKKLILLIKEKNEVIQSLGKNYKYNFENKILKKYRNSKNFRIIGMGGSTLGTQTIYDFLKNKIKKKFLFIDNLQVTKKKNNKEKFTNLIVSKSGNTIETIVNFNFLIKKKR